MGITNNDKAIREINREEERTKKMKNEKIIKKIKKAFKKLNNKNCYGFLTDKENTTYQNFQDFLSLLEKLCEKRYGKRKKAYSKIKVYDLLREIFIEPSKRQIKTLTKLNRVLKKTDDMDILGFKIKGLFKGKTFDSALEKDESEIESK